MYVVWPNTFWRFVTMYLKSLFPRYHVKKSKTHRGGRKTIFFVSTGRWWNNHLHIQFTPLLSYQLWCFFNANFLEKSIVLSQKLTRNISDTSRTISIVLSEVSRYQFLDVCFGPIKVTEYGIEVRFKKHHRIGDSEHLKKVT